MKKEERLIHIKVENNEALEAKKNLLILQMSLLKLAQSVKNFKEKREEELKTKLSLHKKLKEIEESSKKIKEITFPKIKVPEILGLKDLETDFSHEKKEQKSKISNKKDNKDIEGQLKDIQEQLRKLSASN
ncbi:hypothetical protein K9L16_01035 [Candidatus Pacearchaeota archaeon]|nr:hypothetical protein [Candidatus Pacearchaeota archaeon]